MNPQILADSLAELRTKLDALEATAKADVEATLEPVVAPVIAAVEAPAPVVTDIPADAAAPGIAADIEAVHARVDGVASALVMAIQSLDAKIDAGLDVASGWAIHPKVAAASVGGMVATAAAYIAQLSSFHVDGGATTGAGVAALVAVISGYLKKA
jgi:hypothetical protein